MVVTAKQKVAIFKSLKFLCQHRNKSIMFKLHCTYIKMSHAYLSKTSLKQTKQNGLVERDFKFTLIFTEMLTLPHWLCGP